MEAPQLVIMGLKSVFNETFHFYFNILRLVRLNLLNISLLFSTKIEVLQQICFKLDFFEAYLISSDFNVFSCKRMEISSYSMGLVITCTSAKI